MTDTFRALCAELIAAIRRHSDCITLDDEVHDVLDRMRTALAQPEPQGPTDEEIYRLALDGDFLIDIGDGSSFAVQDEVVFARAVLARWGRPAIEPVALSERLPGPEDCDADGQCWGWYRDGRLGFWQMRVIKGNPRTAWLPTHWLPHYALPVPQQEVK